VVPEWYQGGKGAQGAILNIANAYVARAFGVSGRSGQSALVAAWSANGRMGKRGAARFPRRLRTIWTIAMQRRMAGPEVWVVIELCPQRFLPEWLSIFAAFAPLA